MSVGPLDVTETKPHGSVGISVGPADFWLFLLFIIVVFTKYYAMIDTKFSTANAYSKLLNIRTQTSIFSQNKHDNSHEYK